MGFYVVHAQREEWLSGWADKPPYTLDLLDVYETVLVLGFVKLVMSEPPLNLPVNLPLLRSYQSH